jgi:hypothetical protein
LAAIGAISMLAAIRAAERVLNMVFILAGAFGFLDRHPGSIVGYTLARRV